MLSMVEKGAGSKARLAGEQSNAGKQSQAGRQAKRQATGTTGRHDSRRRRTKPHGSRQRRTKPHAPATQKIMGTIAHSLTLST